MPFKNKTDRRKNKKDRKLKANLAVKNFLLENPCVDCGEQDIRVLQFDHIKGKKIYMISYMIHNQYSIKTIFEEISKCQVRCANCHIRKTAIDFDYNKELMYCDNMDIIRVKEELDPNLWKFR